MNKIVKTSTALCLALLLNGLFLAPQAVLAKKTVFKIATISPEGSSWMKLMREGGRKLDAATAGRVKLKFYPSGVMGSDSSVLRKIRVGQLDGAALMSGSLLKYYNENILYALPAIFTSTEEIDCVRPEFDSILSTGLARNGFISFGMAEGGFAYVMSKEPISSVDALRKNKLWVPDHDTTLKEIASAYELKPITLPVGDVLGALQTGLVNTVAVPPVGAIVLQWHTQIQYLTDLPLFYLSANLVVKKRNYEKLDAKDKKIMTEILTEQFKKIDKKNRDDNQKALSVLKENGVKVVTPNVAQIEKWRQRADKYVTSLTARGQLSETLLLQLKNKLASCRQTVSG